MIKEYVEYAVKQLVSNPGAVVIKETESNGKSLILISVAPDDLGKVIGKEGKTIRALRSVIDILPGEQGQQVVLEIAK